MISLLAQFLILSGNHIPKSNKPTAPAVKSALENWPYKPKEEKPCEQPK